MFLAQKIALYTRSRGFKKLYSDNANFMEIFQHYIPGRVVFQTITYEYIKNQPFVTLWSRYIALKLWPLCAFCTRQCNKGSHKEMHRHNGSPQTGQMPIYLAEPISAPLANFQARSFEKGIAFGFTLYVFQVDTHQDGFFF